MILHKVYLVLSTSSSYHFPPSSSTGIFNLRVNNLLFIIIHLFTEVLQMRLQSTTDMTEESTVCGKKK